MDFSCGWFLEKPRIKKETKESRKETQEDKRNGGLVIIAQRKVIKFSEEGGRGAAGGRRGGHFKGSHTVWTVSCQMDSIAGQIRWGIPNTTRTQRRGVRAPAAGPTLGKAEKPLELAA